MAEETTQPGTKFKTNSDFRTPISESKLLLPFSTKRTPILKSNSDVPLQGQGDLKIKNQ